MAAVPFMSIKEFFGVPAMKKFSFDIAAAGYEQQKFIMFEYGDIGWCYGIVKGQTGYAYYINNNLWPTPKLEALPDKENAASRYKQYFQMAQHIGHNKRTVTSEQLLALT